MAAAAEDGTTKGYAVRVERAVAPEPLTASFEDVQRGAGRGRFRADEDVVRRVRRQREQRQAARRLQAAMRSSRLPAVKTLAEFDFTFQPSIKREQIESLHELGFLDRAENVILLGPPGVGKRIWRSAWRSRPPRPDGASTTGR